MANRTGTYFAFDGLGQANPTLSDFRYYAIAQGWGASKNIDFNFVNSHSKASSVKDTSLMTTLKASIQQRLAASKNMVVIVSSHTRKTGSLLSWEIEKAVDYYKIPLIVAYPDYDAILKPAKLSHLWPTALKERIDDGAAQAIHIPFKKEAILDAIQQFTVNSKPIGTALAFYGSDVQVKWGYM